MEKKLSFIINFFYFALWVVAIFVGVKYLIPGFLPFCLGFAISYILRPTVSFLNNKLHLPKSLASVLTVIGFYAVGGAVIWIFLMYMVAQFASIADYLPTLYNSAIITAEESGKSILSGVTDKYLPFLGESMKEFMGIFTNISLSLISSISESIVGVLTAFASNMPLTVITIIFTIISSLLISRNYDGVKDILKVAIPQSNHYSLVRLADFLKNTLFATMRGYIIIMFITFGELLFGLWLLGIDNFFALSFLISLLDLLPVIGSGLVLLPWGIGAILIGESFLGWGILILFAIISFVRNIAEPKIIGDQIGLDPLATTVSMFFGLRFFGVGGMLIAPIVLLGVMFYFKEE